jgi:hypothetical protein
LLIVNPINFHWWTSSSLICAFNIQDRTHFSGEGRVKGEDDGKIGWVKIVDNEVLIGIDGKGKYYAFSNSNGLILKINGANGVNPIT